MPRSFDPFCIKKLNAHFPVIDEYEVHNTVSTDCSIHAPHIATLNTGELTKTSSRGVDKNITKNQGKSNMYTVSCIPFNKRTLE